MKGRRILIEGKKPLIEVKVLLSEAEYNRLKNKRGLTAFGTVENAIRGLLKLQPAPQGYKQINGAYIRVTEVEYLQYLSGERRDRR